jgi:GNAT superfamily N-acetyltransferase
MKVQVQSLSSVHNRKNFDCGQPELNNWLATMARQQQEKNISRTFVAVDLSDPTGILGFYTLTVSDVDGKNYPSNSKLPDRVPVVRLGRFATRIDLQGQGLGSLLLLNALEKIYEISKHAGVAAVAVDAKDQKAAEFYKKQGFLCSPNNPLLLFLFTKTLQQAIRKSEASP